MKRSRILEFTWVILSPVIVLPYIAFCAMNGKHTRENPFISLSFKNIVVLRDRLSCFNNTVKFYSCYVHGCIQIFIVTFFLRLFISVRYLVFLLSYSLNDCKAI